MKQSLAMSAAPAAFAHLLGLGRKPAARRAEDDKPERDDDKDAARAADGDEDEDDKKDGKRGEEPDDEKKDAARADDGDDDEDDKKDGRRGRKARAEDDETCAEEDDEDEDVAAAAKAGRRAERTRCRKIFNSQAAGLRPDVAAQLAFTTSLSSAEALGILEAAASGSAPQASRRIDERMARVVIPSVGADAGAAERQDGPKGKAAAIVGAMNKALGRK